MKTFTMEEIWLMEQVVASHTRLGMSNDEQENMNRIAGKMRNLRESETKREKIVGVPQTVCTNCTYPECGCALSYTPSDEIALLRKKAAAYDRINTPEVDDFLSAVRNEALHQRERWPSAHDSGKTDADWFWLVGYLVGKALHDVKGKQLHHVITAAAALLNWHASLTGNFNAMRPGIEEPS